MTYHTNHSWCSKCNHNGGNFDGEVMVIIDETLSTPFIDENLDDNEEITDLDFYRLTETKDFFNEKEYDKRMNEIQEEVEKKGEVFNSNDYAYEKSFSTKDTVTLKPEVIKWLNENIQDELNTDENTPINKRKAWCIGDDEYNSNKAYSLTVFFSRQKDALKFINKWSIFEKPTHYFDYFHDDSREMNIKEIVERINEYKHYNAPTLPVLDIGDKINIPHEISTDLNEETYDLIDWEEDFD